MTVSTLTAIHNRGSASALHPQQIRRSTVALVGIKAIHTLAWFSIESCMIYLLYAGLRKQSDRRAAIAAAVVGAESLIFAANGFRVHSPISPSGLGRSEAR